MAQACSKDVETLADNLLTISTPESHAYLENVQERDPQLASDIVDIIGEDEDDDGISPESQKIIDEVNKPEQPVSATKINLKLEDQKLYQKKRENFTKKIDNEKAKVLKVIEKETNLFKRGKINQKELDQKLKVAVKPLEKVVKKWDKAKTQFVIDHAPRQYIKSFLDNKKDKKKIELVSKDISKADAEYKKLLKKATKITNNNKNSNSPSNKKLKNTVGKIDQRLKKLDTKIKGLTNSKEQAIAKINKNTIERIKMGIDNIKSIENSVKNSNVNKKIAPLVRQSNNIILLTKRNQTFEEIETIQRRITRAKQKIAWCGSNKGVQGVQDILTRNVKILYTNKLLLDNLKNRLDQLKPDLNANKSIVAKFNEIVKKENKIIEVSSQKRNIHKKHQQVEDDKLPKRIKAIVIDKGGIFDKKGVLEKRKAQSNTPQKLKLVTTPSTPIKPLKNSSISAAKIKAKPAIYKLPLKATSSTKLNKLDEVNLQMRQANSEKSSNSLRQQSKILQKS